MLLYRIQRPASLQKQIVRQAVSAEPMIFPKSTLIIWDYQNMATLVYTSILFKYFSQPSRRWNDVVCLLGNWTKCFYMAIVILNWSTTFFIFWSYICKKTLALLNPEWRILQNVSTFILTIFVGIWDCWDVFVSFKLKFS